MPRKQATPEDQIVCRFCLQEDERNPFNPFLAPCRCTGSIRFVHSDCIKEWRNHANVPAHQIICQLCLTPYYLPRKWQLEMIPSEMEALQGLWYYLSKPWITFILTNYIYFLIIISISPIYQTYAFTYLRPRLLIEDDPTIVWSYMASLCILTLFYIGYGLQQFKKVINKRLYLNYYWNSAYNYLFLMMITISMTFTWPFLFGTLYIIALPYGYNFHCKILLKLNADGEI